MRASNCLLISMSVLMTVITSCHPAHKDVDTDTLNSEGAEDYHADLDIAMTIRSIADALTLGENLDSLDYDYEGILTDGIGHPLYTDIQGSPGVWEVDVLDSSSAVVRNVYLGDLLPDSLRSYLVQSLSLEEIAPPLIAGRHPDSETDLHIYPFDGGYIRFESRPATAPNGLEGPLVSIITSRQLPPDL